MPDPERCSRPAADLSGENPRKNVIFLQRKPFFVQNLKKRKFPEISSTFDGAADLILSRKSYPEISTTFDGAANLILGRKSYPKVSSTFDGAADLKLRLIPQKNPQWTTWLILP